MPRPTPPLPRLLVAGAASVLFAAAGVLFTACGPTGNARFADTPSVVATQATWCTTLAKVNGGGDDWAYLGKCKAAMPTASTSYLRLVAKCVDKQFTEHAGTGPDVGQIAASCGEEATIKMSADDRDARAAIDARCRWAERCAKVPVDECRKGVDKLESSQRAVLGAMYNGAALHEVAECIDGASCTAGEDATYANCYKPVSEKLLWFPRPGE